MTAALRAGLPTTKKIAPIIFEEPELPTGFPDLVAVYGSDRSVATPPQRRLLTPAHLRLLHHLHAAGGATFDDLRKALAWPERALRLHLELLRMADLVVARDERLMPNALSRIFRAQRIVAIEAKISAWRDAIQQAVANTWFASHSYVLLPPRRSIDEVAIEASRAGVGVLIFDGSETRIVVRSTHRQIPASYGSWLVNEWLVRRLGEATHDGPRSDREELP